jgi:Family of unknown function (DUF6152)
MTATRTAGLALAIAGMAVSAFAHHSFAMFDQSAAQRTTLKGKVAEFQWTNPHAFIQMEVVGANGKPEIWSIELNSPNNLKRQGWKSTSLKTGDQITLITAPLRDMSEHKGGLFISLTLADGTVLKEAAFAGNAGPVNVQGPVNAPAAPPPPAAK